MSHWTSVLLLCSNKMSFILHIFGQCPLPTVIKGLTHSARYPSDVSFKSCDCPGLKLWFNTERLAASFRMMSSVIPVFPEGQPDDLRRCEGTGSGIRHKLKLTEWSRRTCHCRRDFVDFFTPTNQHARWQPPPSVFTGSSNWLFAKWLEEMHPRTSARAIRSHRHWRATGKVGVQPNSISLLANWQASKI